MPALQLCCLLTHARCFLVYRILEHACCATCAHVHVITLTDQMKAEGSMCVRVLVQVVAVIGDGAITGGMAYEAMNHAGFLDKNMIVILNDNQQVRLPF